jgi:hypothetical protein
MCWPQTEAGRIATQPCPYYINKFKRNGNNISVQNTYEILFFRLDLNLNSCKNYVISLKSKLFSKKPVHESL